MASEPETTCDKCGRPAVVRALHFEPRDQPGRAYAVGDYGPGCFYAAAAKVRGEGHRPFDARTGRTVFARNRG